MKGLTVLQKCSKLIEGNLPTIFTVAAIGGVILTGVSSYYAAKKTTEVINKVDEEIDTGKCQDRTKEIVKRSWKYYIPVVASAGIAIGSVIGLNVQHKKAYAALLTAYTMSQKDVVGLKGELQKLTSKQKVSDIQEKLSENKIVGDPHQKEKIIDSVTGCEFECSKVAIVSAADMVNQQIAMENYANYNNFLEYLGYSDKEIGMSDKICWRMSGNHPMMNVIFDGIVDKDYNTVTTFSYEYDFDKDGDSEVPWNTKSSYKNH